MRPSERRDVRQELRGNAESVALALRDSMAEVKRVPVNGDGGKKVQAGDAKVLACGGAVADFALTADAQGVLERVVRFALVEPALGPAPQFGVEQPADDEERPLDPPDLAQRQGKIMLARIPYRQLGPPPRPPLQCAAICLRPAPESRNRSQSDPARLVIS